MGEQVPVNEELERALASMRAGFLSGSSQIAAGVGALQEHLAQAPQGERERVGAAVAQIVSTQERLIAQIERLPATAWDRFKRMVGILKAQQAILDDLSVLVKKYVLPRQLQGMSATAASADKAAAAAADPPPAILTKQPPPRRRRVAEPEPEPERDRKGTGFKGLAAMIVAAVILSLIPRETKLQDAVARLAQLVGLGGESAGVAKAEADAEPPKTPLSDPRVARVPKEDDGSEAPDTSPPATGDKETSGPMLADANAAGKERIAVIPPNKRSAIKSPPAGPRQEQFVPVLFTHRNQSTAMQTMNELQQQYPKLLMERKGEIHSVDMGKKGVWHRLVVLPAASRPEAAKLCDELMAEGYDRCWVKVYETD
jgi:sporulation related protein